MSILASDATQQTRVLAITRRVGARRNGLPLRASVDRRTPRTQARACGAHFVIVSPRNIDILLRASF